MIDDLRQVNISNMDGKTLIDTMLKYQILLNDGLGRDTGKIYNMLYKEAIKRLEGSDKKCMNL